MVAWHTMKGVWPRSLSHGFLLGTLLGAPFGIAASKLGFTFGQGLALFLPIDALVVWLLIRRNLRVLREQRHPPS